MFINCVFYQIKLNSLKYSVSRVRSKRLLMINGDRSDKLPRGRKVK